MTSEHRSRTRVVKYEFDGHYDEERATRLLQGAYLKGVVTQYDCGSTTDRGIFIWFEGNPGSALREIREAIARMLPG